MKKLWTGLLVTVMAAALITGCGASNSSAAREDTVATAEAAAPAAFDNGIYYADYDEEAVEEEAEYAAPEENTGESTAEEPAQDSSRKLIKTLNISAETTDLEQTDQKVNARVRALGGYIENSNVDMAGRSNTSYDTDFWGNRRSVTQRTYRSASYTIRVPQAKLEQFAEELAGFSNITNQSYSVEDITLRYVDTESRKTALETEQAALLEMLAKAETVSEMIEIESALSDVRAELQNIVSRLKLYDNQVDYATVYLALEETTVLTDTSTENKSTGQRIAEGFVQGVSNMVYNLQEFVIWLISSLPALVLILLFIALAVLCIRVLVALLRFLFGLGKRKNREDRAEKAKRIEREKRAKEREKDRERREREKEKREKNEEEYIPSYITGSKEDREDD